MATGETDMEYYRLRALADFTGIKSVGLLLLFTQLVGEEQRAKKQSRDPKRACLQLLEAVVAVATEAKLHVENSKAGNDIFMRHYDETTTGYLPDVAALFKWVKTYAACDLPPDSAAD
jgi:hypothetical protein